MERSALITGGSKRIGGAISNSLAENGYDIIVHYHADSEGAEEVVEYARSKGVQAYSIKADLLNDEEILNLVSKSVKLLNKPLTTLINPSLSLFLETYKTVSSLAIKYTENNVVNIPIPKVKENPLIGPEIGRAHV